MNQNYVTGQASLARFIHAKEILLQKTPEGYQPLKLTSITTLVNIVYKDISNERNTSGKQSKQSKHNFY